MAEYCEEYVENLEEASAMLMDSLQNILGKEPISEPLVKEAHLALKQYFKVRSDYSDT